MGGQTPPVAENRYYRACLDLAVRSKGETRFGSLVVKNGRILGRGWNHFARPEEGPIRMGYAFHAEVAAMNDALSRGHSLAGADIYVAGYFAKGGNLYLPTTAHFSCDRCPKYMGEQGIRGVYIPNAGGWRFLTLEEATAVGHAYHRARLQGSTSRQEIGRSRTTLADLGAA
jgi:deoxycytidylate deaminase